MSGPLNGLTDCDANGLPWRGSTRRDSPYYYPGKGILVLLNGEIFRTARIVEFHRLEGWLRVKPFHSDELRTVYGKVDIVRKPEPLTLVRPVARPC